jgi:hypothetical protein
MDFMFALAVPVSVAGESVASRVSASLMAALCSGSARASLVCAMVARDADDYGMLVRRAALMSNSKV